MTDDQATADAGTDEPHGRIDRLKAAAAARLADLRERSSVVDFGTELVDRWGRVNASVVAGHIAFRAFLWIVPMVLLVVAALSFATSADIDLEGGGTLLDLGGATIDSVEASAQQAESSRVQVASIAVIGVALGARSLVKGANLAFAQVWEIPDRKPKGLVAAALRFLGGVIIVVMAIAFVVALRNRGPVGYTVGLGASMAVFAALVLGVSLGLPRRATDWRDLLPGTAAGTGLLVLLKWFSVFYLPSKIDTYTRIYGPVGLSLVFLTYLFLLASALVATAVVNAVWLDERDRFGWLDALLQRVPGPRPDEGDGDLSGGAARDESSPGGGTPR